MQSPPSYPQLSNAPQSPRSIPLKWVLAFLAVSCIGISFFVYFFAKGLASLKGYQQFEPKQLAVLDGTWGRYQFRDVGVQIDLPGEPWQKFHFDRPKEEEFYDGVRYYVIDSETMGADIQSWRGPATFRLDLDRSVEYIIGRIEDDPDISKILDKKIEKTTFDGKQARRITLRYTWHKQNYLFQALVVGKGREEWHVYASSNLKSKAQAEAEQRRLFASIQIDRWGHAPGTD